MGVQDHMDRESTAAELEALQLEALKARVLLLRAQEAVRYCRAYDGNRNGSIRKKWQTLHEDIDSFLDIPKVSPLRQLA